MLIFTQMRVQLLPVECLSVLISSDACIVFLFVKTVDKMFLCDFFVSEEFEEGEGGTEEEEESTNTSFISKGKTLYGSPHISICKAP